MNDGGPLTDHGEPGAVEAHGGRAPAASGGGVRVEVEVRAIVVVALPPHPGGRGDGGDEQQLRQLQASCGCLLLDPGEVAAAVGGRDDGVAVADRGGPRI